MSRYNYLLLILVFLFIGCLLFGQLKSATETATDLIKKEITDGLKIRINNFFTKKNRYPDSKNEIQAIIDSFKINRKNLVKKNFFKGNKLSSSSYVFKFNLYNNETFFQLMYFGCEYCKDYKKRGRLVACCFNP